MPTGIKVSNNYATFKINNMEIRNNKLISVQEADIINGIFRNETVTEIGYFCFYELANLKEVYLPKVTTVGSGCFRYNEALTTLSLPALTTAGNGCFCSNNVLTTLTLPALTTAGYGCFRSNEALTTLSLPALTTAGYNCFHNNEALTTLSLPALTTAGSYCFRGNEALTTLSLKELKLNIKTVDGYCYIIEKLKKRNNIMIYSGGDLVNITDGAIKTEPCYVAEKGNYTAHGNTIKQAITDLQFKIISEKLRKEPINADTIITVQYYRIVTGACQAGCESWLRQNNITKTEYTAAELLPILENSNAYGYQSFKQLCNF